MRRILQRLRTALARPGVVFIYHPSYARTVSGVPIDPARADEILAFLLDQGLIRRRDVSRPIPASLANLLRVHTPAYLESLQDPATLTAIFGAPVPVEEVQDILELQRLSVGGTIQATRLALGGGRVAVNLKGGLHHAAPGRGMGFCMFNDVAVAIQRLRARGFTQPVLVIDLDLHDGNGTRSPAAIPRRTIGWVIGGSPRRECSSATASWWRASAAPTRVPACRSSSCRAGDTARVPGATRRASSRGSCRDV